MQEQPNSIFESGAASKTLPRASRSRHGRYLLALPALRLASLLALPALPQVLPALRRCWRFELARVLRPESCGPSPAARVLRPESCGPSPAARVLRPGQGVCDACLSRVSPTHLHTCTLAHLHTLNTLNTLSRAFAMPACLGCKAHE